MSGYRLSSGGLIDRSASLSFQFDGKGFKGHPGDTLASALIASGETLLGRSFKYHRPRGVLTAGPEEPNALVELRTGARKEPNTRSTTIELYEGLEATSQNRWPSLKRDFLSINQLAGPLFVGGFYYKTFMWPAAFWEKLYEPMIRRAAGMGKVSGLPDPDSYDKAYAFCDVLVIGGGPTGLAAALAAARAGARVILCDDDFQLGGRLLSERQSVDGMPGAEWAAKAAAELAAMPEVRILRRTQVFGVYDGMVHGALERVCDHLIEPAPHQPRQRMWKLVSKRTILAAGAVERQLVFGGNDKPGVMMAAGVRTYLNRYGVSPGKNAAVFTTTDDGWRTAADLAAAGVNVAAVVDARSEVSEAVQALAGGARAMLGSVVLDAKGGLEVSSIDVSTGGKSSKSFDVDLLAVSGGWNPQVALSTHLGSKPVWSDDIHSFIPGTPPPGMTIAGAAAGRMSLADCLSDGTRLGTEAAASLGLKGKSAPKAPRCEAEATSNAALWRVTASKTKSFVDQQHDVTAKDIEIAAHEGYQSVEHLKRYTTLGMATDQGKTSNVNGHALMAGLTGRTMQQAGTTMARPPHQPVAIGAFGGSHRGQHFRPSRLVSSHAWAEKRGAVFVDAGQWKRAQWFPLPGENDWLVSVSREVVATRTSVGVCDVSTLGKIDVQGPDAGVFLDRLYVNTFSTLAVGKARYGLMLREDGLVLDDGTAARLAPEHYMVTTTTANAARVMQHMEYCRQVLWPELDVQQVSVTEQWAQYAVAGPNSRKLLETFFGGALDISNEAVPYMGVAQTVFRGVPLRLFRLSFSGEMAYEIAVPARYGEWLIEALMAAGEAYDVVPYGTEALGVMRIEKGHVGGNELNGTTTVTDIGLGKMASKKKDYIGRTLAGRPGLVDPDRPAFVGFKAVDRSRRLRSGAHFLSIGAAATAKNDEGYMTSVAYSPMLECWVGLGFIKNGPARIGQRARAYDALRDQDIEVEICSPIFFDPEGARLHG